MTANGEVLERSDFLRGFFIAATVALLVFVAIVSFWTLLSVRTTQTQNGGTISKLTTITGELNSDQLAQLKGNATVSKIFKLAGQEVSEINQKLAILCLELNAKC